MVDRARPLQETGTPAQFYKNALLFLSYTPVNKMSKDEKVPSLLPPSCARALLTRCVMEMVSHFRMLAARFGFRHGAGSIAGRHNLQLRRASHTSDFQRVDGHPVPGESVGVVVLVFVAQPPLALMCGLQWLAEVLRAFNAGIIGEYEILTNKYQAELNAQPALVANVALLKQKITILSLLELLFQRPADNRTITFAEIAQQVVRCYIYKCFATSMHLFHSPPLCGTAKVLLLPHGWRLCCMRCCAVQTKLPIDEVEMLIMKALSAKLVKGVIDQVDQTVAY